MTPEETQQEIDRINAEIQQLVLHAECIASQIDQLKHWQEVKKSD